MPKHAYLSASASHRWLACPPSAKLCANILDQASEYAQQGTDCHELCAYLVEKALGRDVIDPTENLTYYDAEMQNCAEEYRNYVLEQIEAAKEFCKDPQVMIEQRLDFSRWVENGFGTGDCVIVADEVLQIIDYKHGLGILVSVGDDEHGGNSQMMCYALGALEVFGDIYDINQIKMTIFQPRRDNISTYTISKKNLLKWADEVLAPTAQLAYVGKGEFNAGDHCTFCKVIQLRQYMYFCLLLYVSTFWHFCQNDSQPVCRNRYKVLSQKFPDLPQLNDQMESHLMKPLRFLHTVHLCSLQDTLYSANCTQ